MHNYNTEKQYWKPNKLEDKHFAIVTECAIGNTNAKYEYFPNENLKHWF